MKFGTVADWLAAIGTIGAFAAGLYLIRREQGARHEQAQRETAANARLLKVELAISPDHVAGGTRITLRYTNESDAIAFTDVHTRVMRQDEDLIIHEDTFDAIGPGQSIPRQGPIGGGIDPEYRPRWRVRYTDDVGVRWVRDELQVVRRA